jgi:hypothetical protein
VKTNSNKLWRKKLAVVGLIVGVIGAFGAWILLGATHQTVRISKAPSQTEPAVLTATGGRKHLMQGATIEDAEKLKLLGYTVIELAPDVDALKKLPSGMQAMIKTGGVQCSGMMSWSVFKKFVLAQRYNSKIYGYTLSNEPRTDTCPEIVKAIRDRADYIHCLAIRGEVYSNGVHKVASDGSCLDSSGKKIARKTGHKAYLSGEANHAYGTVRESLTHVDIFTVNAYPCRFVGCVYSGGDQFRQQVAKAKKYFAPSRIVPVYYALEGDRWNLPTSTQLKAMIAEYKKLVPDVQLDSTYAWRDTIAGGPSGVRRGLIDLTDLQLVLGAHNSAQYSL